MLKAIGKSLELLMRTIFLGAEKAAEKAVGYAELYIKGLAFLGFLSIVFPIPFLIWGVSTGQRVITSLTGLYWFMCVALVFAIGTPLGVVLETIGGGPKGSYLRYRQFFAGLFSTGLFVSMLFSIIPIAANLTYFPLFLIVLLILGMLNGRAFKRWVINFVTIIVFIVLLFTFMLPATYESLIVKLDAVNRPARLDITYEDTQAKGFSFFRSDGKNIYWYALTLDGRFELFNIRGHHPLTNEKLRPLDSPAVKVLMERLKSDYDRRINEKRKQQEVAHKNQAAAEAEKKKHELGAVTVDLANMIIQRIQVQRQRNLALMPFTQHDSGRVTALAMRIYSGLRPPILDSSRVTLVDETKVGEVLANTPEYRPSALTSQELNKLRDVAGAHFLLRGTCQEIGEMVEISWYLTNLISSEVYKASTVKVLKDYNVSGLLRSYVDESIIFPKPIFTPPLPDPPPQESPKLSEAVRSQPTSSSPVAASPVNPRPALWPKVIDYDDVNTKINARDLLNPNDWRSYYDRTSRPSGYHLVELTRAVIQEETITFALIWTNLTSADARLYLARLNSSGFERPFVQDKNGRKYYCSSFVPSDGQEIKLKRKTPVNGQITFANFLRSDASASVVDLYIQVQGKPNPTRFIILRSIRLLIRSLSTPWRFRRQICGVSTKMAGDARSVLFRSREFRHLLRRSPKVGKTMAQMWHRPTFMWPYCP